MAGLVLLVLLGLCATGVYIYSITRGESEGSWDRLQESGVIRIGYANEAPYGYIDSTTGEITGEAPEIAKVVLKRMGIDHIEPVVTEFGSLIPGLKAGRFDVIAAGMYITPERAREIDFSNPTYAIGEALIVAAGNPLALHGFEDIARHESARIGVMGGSVEHVYARKLDVPEPRIVVLPDYPSAIEALKTDRIDAVAATILTANDLLRKADSAEIELADPFTDPVIDGESVKGYGAFGFRREDDELRQRFNAQLADFIGSPEHLALVRPFGFSQQTLPGDVTADELIASPAEDSPTDASAAQ
ncbi:MAG: ectoine/hydroxyectoine ABC transporter substrate-binding protein EhuB [Pirellulales bacterium]